MYLGFKGLEDLLEERPIKDATLHQLTTSFGYLERVERDLEIIEKELKFIRSIQEEWLNYKKEIIDKINYLSNQDFKYVLKVVERFKKSKTDYYFLNVSVLKVNQNSNVLIDNIRKYKLSFAERGKVFNSKMEEIFNDFEISEIYSNKKIKNHSYKPLEEFKIV